jgi:hypothetical protein
MNLMNRQGLFQCSGHEMDWRNSTHHTSPNLQSDLNTVIKSLAEERIHTQDLNRCFSDKTLSTKDILAGRGYRP